MTNEKDIAEKTLQSYNDVFADIVNGLLFDGEPIVRPEELTQARARSSYPGEARLREQERDEAKFWRRANIRIALLGFENETEPNPNMPIRVMGYDGAAYRDQLGHVQKEDRARDANYYPVVTLVLYFGYKRHWNTARTLLDNLGEFDRRIIPYVSDYRINLFEIAWLSDEQIRRFKSDFRIVADYFSQMRRTGSYKGSPDEIRHVKEIMDLMTYLTKDSRFQEAYEEKKRKGLVIGNMCEWIDAVEEKGRQAGLKEGRQEGLEEGRQTGREEGRQEGLEEGRQTGREEGRQEGRQTGREEGLRIGLIRQCLKKFRRGCSSWEAADALEEKPEETADIYTAIRACGSDASPEAILHWMNENKPR